MQPDRGPVRTAAMLFIGAVGVVAVGVQSAMYGALERADRIGVTEIGYAASAEMVALALGVVIAGKLARRVGLAWLVCLGAAALALANLAMPYAVGMSIVGLRTAAGFAGGILLWLGNAYVVQARRVVQLAALFLILQTAMQFSVAAGAAAFVPQSSDAIPLIMAGSGALAFVLAPAVWGWAALPESHMETLQKGFGLSGIVAMMVMLLLQFSLVGGWILVELVGAAANLSPGTIAAATPIMLAAQVAGGLIAMALSERLSWSSALMIVGLFLGVVQVLLAVTVTALPFLAAAFVYGLLWNFALPQLTAMGLAVDPTMRLARIGPAAVITGAALGPLVAAALAERISPATATMGFSLPSLLLVVTVLALGSRIRLAQKDSNR